MMNMSDVENYANQAVDAVNETINAACDSVTGFYRDCVKSVEDKLHGMLDGFCAGLRECLREQLKENSVEELSDALTATKDFIRKLKKHDQPPQWLLDAAMAMREDIQNEIFNRFSDY